MIAALGGAFVTVVDERGAGEALRNGDAGAGRTGGGRKDELSGSTPRPSAQGEETYYNICISCHPKALCGRKFKTNWGGRRCRSLDWVLNKMPKNDPAR
jgi:hypothetical protein